MTAAHAGLRSGKCRSNYTIDHETRLVRARAEGIITLKDIEDFSDAVVAQDALAYRKLFDASEGGRHLRRQ